MLFSASFIGEIMFMKKKDQFLRMLTSIKEDEIKKELMILTNFEDSIRKNNLIHDYENLRNKKIFTSSKEVGKPAARKLLRVKSTNSRSRAMLGIQFLFHAIIFGICLAIFMSLITSIIGIKTNMRDATRVNKYFLQYNTIFLTLYQYFMGETFTVRNKPFLPEWQKDYDEVVKSADFLNGIRDTVDSSFIEQLDLILRGDLCTMMYALDQCVAREEAKQGLIGVNTIAAEAAREAMASFQRSDKSFNAVVDILAKNSFLTMEYIYWIYQPPAYQ